MGARADGDVARDIVAADRAGERRADQADADEGDLVEQRFMRGVGHLLGHELAEHVGHLAHFVFEADRDAEVVG